MSRQLPTGSNSNSESPVGQSSSNSSPIDPHGNRSEFPSSPSPPHRVSESDGYPSWLPKRPPPPAPASTFQSSAHSEPIIVGRKPTPRSVRIINLQDSSQGERRDLTEQTRVGHNRVWSRATSAGMSPTVFGSAAGHLRVPRPKFRASALHPELLQSPSLRTRLQFYFLPLFVFVHIPLQTFFDFNAVFILLQVSKYPNPETLDVPGSGRNWALGAAGYIACWAVWIFVVFTVYELIYSFFRRWRVKHPAIFPLYLSSSANNLVSMTSYTNFCFMRHIRRSAFSGENGSFRDGIAETFWFYSQNLPTVALLLPRAGLSLALLFAFSSPQPSYVALIDNGTNQRDDTFFRANDGTLTNYARGVLIANAAWTAWRALVLLCSWIGLWIISGQPCAGICGPRYRWEEEDAEKRASVYTDNESETDAIPWNWREGTQLRVQEAYDFCLTVRPSSRWGTAKKEVSDASQLPDVSHSPAFDGMEQVMAAVGFPSSPQPARRGALSDDLFDSPKDEMAPAELSAIIPIAAKRPSREKDIAGPSGPLKSLPYPFSGFKAQVSSEDQVPFPPSPEHTGEGSEEVEEEYEEVVEHDDQGEEEGEGEEGEEEVVEYSEEPSSQSQGRTSGSMSSLGQPVSSRYPFQFRRPGRGHSRGHSMSSTVASRLTPHSQSSHSTHSGSANSRSTGNRSSGSPESLGGSSSVAGSPLSASSFGGQMPMPPRHPQPTRGRARAGSVPSDLPSSSSPVVFPRAVSRPRARRIDNDVTQAFGQPEPQPANDEEYSDEEEPIERPVPEGPHEAAEGEDHIGLLSAGPSPRTSFIGRSHRPSNLSRRSQGSRSSGSSSSPRSRTGSAISGSKTGSSVRSRTQSLIQSIGAASRSSLELVQTTARLRANSSMARLEEDLSYHSDSPSQPSSANGSGNENHTFGHPMFAPRESAEGQTGEAHGQSTSNLSVIAASEQGTMSSSQQELVETTGEHVSGGASLAPSIGTRPGIGTTAPSFVTEPATQEGTSEASERTESTYAEVSHMVDPSDGL